MDILIKKVKSQGIHVKFLPLWHNLKEIMPFGIMPGCNKKINFV